MSRFSWRRTAAAVALCASAALLTACGSSSTESALNPSRLISFGDSFADVGQSGGAKYTVNDGSTNHWLQEVTLRYGITVTPSSAGGLGYAEANARVSAKPDAAGSATTLTMTEQIDKFLAANSFGESDLVVVAGGMGDLVTAGVAFRANTLTQPQLVAQAEQAGRDLAAQSRRLVAAGARHVVVVGPYDISITPWGQGGAGIDALREASRRLVDVFKIDTVDLGKNVLYVDAPDYFNVASDRDTIGNFGMNNSVNVVCTSVDAGPGVGLGANRVNSALCTASTVLAGANYNEYMFADELYITPNLHRRFGDHTYDKIRNRW